MICVYKTVFSDSISIQFYSEMCNIYGFSYQQWNANVLSKDIGISFRSVETECIFFSSIN